MGDKRQINSIAHSSSGMRKPIETELQNKSEIYFNDGKDVYLYNGDQKYLFRATYSSAGSSVDDGTPEHHAKFLITHCYGDELQKWADYDPELHFVDIFVMWDKRKAKLYYDRREKGLEKVIPEDTVQKYREHYPRCKHKFGDKECPFSEDKVFFQWKRLRAKEETPVKAKRKGRKRGEKHKKPRVVRKKLRLAGKEYQTGSGKTVKTVKEMKYVTCKCHCRCVENVSPEDRQTSYDSYWSTTEYLQRKQSLFDRLSQAYPK